MKSYSHEEFRNEDELDASAYYIAGYRDPSSVAGVPTDLRRYPPEPFADSPADHENDPVELVGNYVPRSHFQPELKFNSGVHTSLSVSRKKWRMAGDVIAFLFLAFGFCLMLVYFGVFRVIGAVIHEVMQ